MLSTQQETVLTLSLLFPANEKTCRDGVETRQFYATLKHLQKFLNRKQQSTIFAPVAAFSRNHTQTEAQVNI